MRQLFVFYRGDLIDSICEIFESALNEEEWMKPGTQVVSIIAPTIDDCWDRLNEFDDLGLHAVGGHWEIVP